MLPKNIETWSLTSLQQRLVKTGGRLVKHAQYFWLLLAESHLTRPVRSYAAAELGAARARRLRARRLEQGCPASETRGDRCPRKCFGTEGQSIGCQREPGFRVSRA